MIQIGKEEILTFKEVCERLPTRRGGGRIHVGTVHRWATRGVGGVVLEFVSVGATRCTSPSALDRFFAAVAQARSVRGARKASSTAHGNDSVSRELDREGV